MFKAPRILDSEQANGLTYKPVKSYEAAASVRLIPVSYEEIPSLALDLPVVFLPSHNSMPHIMLGLNDNSAALDSKHRWKMRTTPAYLNIYPFALSNLEDGTKAVNYDSEAPHFTGKGKRLFTNDGQSTETLEGIKSQLVNFNRAIKQTGSLVEQLRKDGLLTSRRFKRMTDGQEENFEPVVELIDEEKLNKLPAETLSQYQQSGIMKLLHSQIASLQNLDRLN